MDGPRLEVFPGELRRGEGALVLGVLDSAGEGDAEPAWMEVEGVEEEGTGVVVVREGSELG